MARMTLGAGSIQPSGRHSEQKRNAAVRNGNLRKLAAQYKANGQEVPKNVQADIKRTAKDMM